MTLLPPLLEEELAKYRNSLSKENRNISEKIIPHWEVMQDITLKIIDIKNESDFRKHIGEDYLTEEYDLIIHHLEFRYHQEKIKELEYDYRTGRLAEIFDLFVETTEKGEYSPSIIMTKYKIEYEIAKSKLSKLFPKQWETFERLQKQFYDTHNLIEGKAKRKETLIDYFREKNRRKKEEVIAPGKVESTDVKPPLLKHNDELSKMSAYNLDGIYDDSSMDKSRMEVGTSETTPDKKSTEKTGTSGKTKGKQKKPDMKEYLERRAEIFKEAAIKKGQKLEIEGKLKKERVAAKRTPSVAVEPPHVESDYEDEYFSHLSSIESEEESEQESEKFRETKKILEEISESKKTAQNLLKPTQAGPAGRSQEMPAKPNEGEKEIFCLILTVLITKSIEICANTYHEERFLVQLLVVSLLFSHPLLNSADSIHVLSNQG
ncbi:hypothetical protein JTB14_009307 [Gonioctena quinquepunctata]|nr:hypothetical protein JTB14_009307 [Gonioctena quinquepunctata]